MSLTRGCHHDAGLTFALILGGVPELYSSFWPLFLRVLSLACIQNSCKRLVLLTTTTSSEARWTAVATDQRYMAQCQQTSLNSFKVICFGHPNLAAVFPHCRLLRCGLVA